MPNVTKLEHALHNEKACAFLMQDDEFADWAVIAAFYAAIHFIDHKIFPIKHKLSSGKSIAIKNLDEYRNVLGISRERHAVHSDLVRKNCSQIQYKFDWLKNTCWTVRYSNYLLDNRTEVLKKAKDYLDIINKYCNP